MNQATFEGMMNDSGLLNKDTLSELEQLLIAYPFCQTFHLLYTRNLYQLGHIRYNQQLKVAAAVVGDRTRLKYYIENTDHIIDNEKEQLVSPVESIPVVVKEIINESIEQSEEAIPKTTQSEEWEKASESILLTSLDTSISREEKKKAIIALINKKFSERNNIEKEEVIIEKKPAESVQVESHVKKKEDIFNISDQITEEQIILAEGVSDLPIESTPNAGLSVESRIEKVDLDYLEGFALNNDPGFHEEQFLVPEKKGITDSNILIENFLRDAPRISRPKKEFFNPVNLAARSVVENEDFYTETYATICLRQGNVSKALKIYEKLSLKFPEKSSYFAGLIEKIKKEQNI